jgi:hypothetical protein
MFSREGEDVYLRCAVEGRPEPNSLHFSKDVRKATAPKSSKNERLNASPSLLTFFTKLFLVQLEF